MILCGVWYNAHSPKTESVLPRKIDVTDEMVIAVYHKCKSAEKAALTLGIGTTTAHRILKRNNVERSGLVEYRKTMGLPKQKPYIGIYNGSTEEILNWYNDGLSMKTIAKKIGRSVRVVSNRISKAGIARPFQGSGPEHSMWKGGRREANEGYWRVWVGPDHLMASMRNHQGYILEHRLIMALSVGRPLRDDESVHHIDGDHGNNDISNLQLRRGSHGKHVVMVCLNCGSHNIGHAPLGESEG